MLKPNTLLVLGAAMSAEIGMPLGEGLKSNIAAMLPEGNTGNDFVRDALFVRGDLRTNQTACEAIQRALPKAASIDNLIEHRRQDVAFRHCAKVGIVASIIKAEQGSRVYRPPGRSVGSMWAADSTYAALFRLVVGNAAVDGLAEAISRVQIINFNYDRCLEHYFHDWLVAYSGLRPDNAWRLIDGLCVVRPYGTIGPLARIDSPATNAVPFGANLDGLDLNALADNVLTFSEERASGVDVSVRTLTSSAKEVIFLGCAFHPQNMRLLRPGRSEAQHFYGTCYVPPPKDELSQPSLDSFCGPTREAFALELNNWPASNTTINSRVVQFESITCRQLVAKYAPQWIEQSKY